ncbi:MAG: helix-turn-helix domain-containing protein [Candidatus Dormibacteria bacterium]
MPDLLTAPRVAGSRLLLDVVQVAEALGCGRTYVYELIGRRELVPVKLGRLTRFTMETVEDFVRRKVDEASGCRQP